MQLGRTVPELLASTTSMELTNWAAYFIHEPFGNEWRAFAKLAAWIAAAAGHRDSDAVIQEFMPARYEKSLEELIAEDVPQSEEEIKARLTRFGHFFQSQQQDG